ncbi:extracellular solute-binding protein [Rhizobium sp. BE258]|jgi:putative spermidine/putrescine transport system substrate-binding protein|uniref:extracellular solute-binding protein n=1 Tax=Rhizobium sp. BE258 TaxID=2817722 RepID=UPI00286250EB|nr:extracellular solute-binding protein [Rhizobium sp. BE258]MDR7147753.1 putative spermidine/putrescine transport system substrate-binding protein [Rhizobium sp. BE258]
MPIILNRRAFVIGAGIAGLSPLLAMAKDTPGLPPSPVSLNVIDVGGALALLQPSLESFRDTKKELVSRVTFSKAPAPELPGKLKAQQSAGRVDIDLVIGGLDVLSAGIDQKLWVPLLADYGAVLPKPDAILQPTTIELQKLAQDQAFIAVYTPSGPLLEYAPDRVKTPPTSADELLAWATQNPNRFLYARPANSGPGRTWLMGLPYILGDKDPKDPVNGWEKTWSFLVELGKHIEYYPTGTGALMKEFGEGSRDMTVTTLGWDINPRALGIVPAEAKTQTLKGFHWIADAQYLMVPNGISDEKLAVALELVKWVLSPEQQATTYDQGYFYPGPAVKDVGLDKAPDASKAVIEEFGRPEYDKLIAETPIEIPLMPDKMVAAFRLWDERVGADKKN